MAKVGDEPAVTKSQQRIDLGPRLTPLRYPGHVVAEDRASGRWLMLAASHAVGVNAYIDEEVATWLAGFLLAAYPNCCRRATAFRSMASMRRR